MPTVLSNKTLFLIYGIRIYHLIQPQCSYTAQRLLFMVVSLHLDKLYEMRYIMQQCFSLDQQFSLKG